MSPPDYCVFFNVCRVFVHNTCFQTTVVIYCRSVYLSLIVTRLFSSIYLKLFVCLSLLPLDDPPGAACSAQRLRARKLSWGGETNVIAQILILINFLPGAAQPEAV